MNRIFSLTLLLVLFVSMQSCNKDDTALLTGTWEWVNVENVIDPYSYEWEFENGNITIYRRLKTNPGTFTIIERGFYLIDSNPAHTTLKLTDMSNQLWNDSWDVVKLNKSHLIIKLDIVGGVLYREYVRKK